MKNTNRLRLFCIILLCCFAIFHIENAWSWVDNGVAICTATTNQESPQLVLDGQGGTIITWQDNRNGIGTDIYAQAIDSTGTVKWTLDGIAICMASASQSFPQLVSDGNGGAIITWQDSRNGNPDIYAQTIDSTGSVKWTQNGVVICTDSGVQVSPKLVSDGQGGAIITWGDVRNSNWDVYAQAINSTGSVKWTQNGVIISNDPSNQTSPQLVSDGQGGAVLTWCDSRNGSHDNNIYAQAISNTGTVKWKPNGIAICTTYGDQYNPQLVSDRQGGAIITWCDERNGEPDTNADIYAQSINSTGMIMWALNGVAICTVSGNQMNPNIVSDYQCGAIITWQDNRNSNDDIYIQAINSIGTVKWTLNGINICTASNNQYYPQIISDGEGAIITWCDERYGNANIYAQSINSTGTVKWTQNGVVICSAPSGQTNQKLTSDGQGGGIVTWCDYRNGDNNTEIFALNIYYRYSENVQNFILTPGDKKVTLNWNNPTGADYLATRILRRTDRYPTGPNDGTSVYWFNGTVCIDTGLINGQTYYYGIFSHDTSYSYATGAYASVFLNYYQNYDNPMDTTFWAFQQSGNVSQMPSYSWISSYYGRTGILKLNYSSMTEGLKLTSIARLYNGTGNNRYRLRVQYASDSPNNGQEIVSQLLSYKNHESYTITEIGGDWTGNGQISSNRWYTFDTYVFSQESSQQIQLILKNNGSSGDYYIDSIQCDSLEPLAIVNPILVPMTIGDFNIATDTNSWAFQSIPSATNGMGTLNWVSSLGTQTGVIAINFNQANQGIKITSIPTYTIATNRNAVMFFKFRSNLSNPTTLHILGYLYGEGDLATFKVDLAGKGVLGNFAGNQWNTMYIPLTSVSGNSNYRLQLVLKNNNQTPETVYLDDVQLYTTDTY